MRVKQLIVFEVIDTQETIRGVEVKLVALYDTDEKDVRIAIVKASRLKDWMNER